MCMRTYRHWPGPPWAQSLFVPWKHRGAESLAEFGTAKTRPRKKRRSKQTEKRTLTRMPA
eukprot:8231469-Pyramimonas_sp.AAC.1